MPQVVFTANLRRYVSCDEMEVDGTSVRMVLEKIFAQVPNLQGYILDDQGQLRQHVLIFVDGEMVLDRKGLSDLVKPSSEIYVMQALSGG